MDDTKMNGEVSVEEVEIGDTVFWMEEVTSKIQEIEATTAFINQTVTSKIKEIETATAFVKQGMQRIAESAKEQEILNLQREELAKEQEIINLQREGLLTKEQEIINLQQEVENTQATLDTSFNTEKLTPTAKRLITQFEDDPLNPDEFEEFLMEKIFGKPRPPALPIVRGYTRDVKGLLLQLDKFRKRLKQSHREYMTTHKKDENLERRIKRLMENIETELTAEERDGRQQTSMDFFTVPINEN